MSSPEEKKKRKRMSTTKKKKPTPQSTPNPSLSDDLLLSCFARVSRLYYPTLSLVSKTFQSILAWPELYKARSSLGRKESCLYVCLLSDPDPIPRWYTLCRKPDRTLTTNGDTMKLKKKKKSSGYVLAKLPTPHSGPANWSGLVTLGSDIYNFGGSEEPSSSVLILDSRSNTWREGRGSKHAGEAKLPSGRVDGKVYIFGGDNGLAYRPKEGQWERVGWEMDTDWPWFSFAVIDNVLCNYIEGGFRWYDTTARLWKV
uniref:Uncharacterized protein n=1 Tax=Brassica oleracea TaxID=3712 RepID=A0A3P6FDC2_BRAOL|nr:unnamed protein product [Brassica oleracea]